MKGCDNVCSLLRGAAHPRPGGQPGVRRGAAARSRRSPVGRARGDADRAERELVPGRLLLRRAAPARRPGAGHPAGPVHHQPPARSLRELVDAFGSEPKIAPHFHLPVQRGADRVLKRMQRDYTVPQYLERLAKLRAARPGSRSRPTSSWASPARPRRTSRGPSKLTEQVRYENQFSFVFSARPRTVAALKEPEWGAVRTR